MKSIVVIAALGCCLQAVEALALDAFDRHTSSWLKQAAKKNAAVKELSSADAAKLATLEPRITSPCVVVQTDQGNWTKALVNWALRKVKEKLVPVLIIERYVTYDQGRGDSAAAHGENVMIFPGFEFDFDIGQVVPKEAGGDVVFTETRRLAALPAAKLHGVNGPVLPPAAPDKYDPTGQRGVRPRDFAGTWRVNADGRWTGTWQIAIDDEGNVTGQYTSDTTKSTSPIQGRITTGQVRHRLRFDVEFPAAQQHYDMYLWTIDKQMMAGTTTLINRTFGVFAVRETEAAPSKSGAPIKQSAIERLKKPITIKLDGQPLDKALQSLAEKTGVPARLRQEELRAAKISIEQPITLEARDKPGDEVLRGLLRQAAEQLVYLIERRGEHESIAVTTRQSAEQRGERLPPELREPLAERLKQKLTLRSDGELPVETALEQAADALGADVLIRADEFPGLAEKQPRASLDFQQTPASEVFDRLLSQAFPEDEAVYVLQKIDGEEFLVITTRAALKAQSEKLPKK